MQTGHTYRWHMIAWSNPLQYSATASRQLACPTWNTQPNLQPMRVPTYAARFCTQTRAASGRSNPPCFFSFCTQLPGPNWHVHNSSCPEGRADSVLSKAPITPPLTGFCMLCTSKMEDNGNYVTWYIITNTQVVAQLYHQPSCPLLLHGLATEQLPRSPNLMRCLIKQGASKLQDQQPHDCQQLACPVTTVKSVAQIQRCTATVVTQLEHWRTYPTSGMHPPSPHTHT